MRLRSSLLLASFASLFAAGCSRDSEPTGPAPISTEARVFIDNFIASDFQAFAGSKLDAVQLDNVVKYRGTSSLRITVPAATDPSGSYAGGAFVATAARNLSRYNAITFYARASTNATLNVAGLGNDNTGSSLYMAERNNIALTTAWQKYTIMIPLSSRLTLERGLFYFAEGAEAATGYEFWLDDIRFETLTTITNIRPALAPATVTAEIGGTYQVGGLTVTAAVDGVDQTVTAFPGYFAFTSSNAATATVSAGGLASVLAAGTTNITASLGGASASGAIALTALAPPASAAPTPTRAAADVISLFSGAYTNRTVDTWSASWDQADVADVNIAGNATKKYTNLVFAGVEFTSAPVNATTMTHVHVDVFVNNNTTFKLKLVNFGANGTFGGGDDSEHEVTYTATSTPAMVAGGWTSLDIPLSAFTGLTGRSSLAQLVISGSSATTYIDNLYFYKVPAPTEPPAAAPAPTADAAKVISLFSNTYTNVPVSAWGTDWDQADVADVSIGGNATKKITNFTFVGIEFTSPTINASAMTHFNFDYWTADPTGAGEELRVKLVDFGANGSFGGGDDTEHELTFTAATTPGIKTGEWVRFSIPLSSFTGLTTRGHLAQLIMVSGPNTVFLDNIYFSDNGTSAPTVPGVAAPTPTYASGDVISLFSNAYTNVPVSTWSAEWDQADVADVQIAGNATKRYTNLTFAGIEFTAPTINATSMTHFRLDIWTPDASAVPAAFKVKLVDFGANNAFGGGDDREHELSFEATTTPALATGAWITLDIPLSQFTGLTTRGNLAQLIFVGLDPINTVFVDNLLFHK
jgi:hypothetical protein